MSLNFRHPWVRIGLWVVGLLMAGALVWFLVGRLFPDNPPGPTESQTRSDSLRITKPNDDALIAALDARIDARGESSARATAAAIAAIDRAARARRVADSLALARQWEGAYNERTLEAVDLRKTVGEQTTVIVNLKADTTDLRLQLATVNKRLKTTEDVNEGLFEDVTKARRCKILGLLNCPSRIQTAALTALTVVAVDRYRGRSN